ncbi:hypothetical protein [Luteolibacter sp. AS25]|uniref:hypothetical protein n=1 Tax=Luteolibacter sp. AS25 TaxID=3135776 RepID=UPI00398A6DDA
MALPETWNVRSRSRKCTATGTPFSEGQKIITALFPDPESSGYLRKDFCEAAWKEIEAGSELSDQPFSHWRTTFIPAPINENVQPVTKQTAEDLLRNLVEEDQDHTENTRYILAVMLERQKLLRETDTQPTSGGTLRIYEHRKTGEVFIVKDPNIPLAQVEEIQNEVIELLSPKPIEEPETEIHRNNETPS